MKKEIYEPLTKKIRELVQRLLEDDLIITCKFCLRSYLEEITLTLEDVLEATNNKLFYFNGVLYDYTYINHSVDIKDDDFFKFIYTESVKWEHGKPLSGQSDELGQFLTDIIL